MRILMVLFGLVMMMGCSKSKEFWGPTLEVSPPNSVMGRYDVNVSTGRLLSNQELSETVLDIDVIALTNNKYCQQKWFEYDLASYFDPNGNELRDNAPVWRASLNATENNKTLAANNPIWSIWESTNATHLVIIANEVGDGKTEPNARRMVIPLDRSLWLEDEIKIRLMESGLVLRTRRLPPWPGQPKEKYKRY